MTFDFFVFRTIRPPLSVGGKLCWQAKLSVLLHVYRITRFPLYLRLCVHYNPLDFAYVLFKFACFISRFIVFFVFAVSKGSSMTDAIKKSPVSMVEAIICFFSVWSILGLAGFHTYLIFSNLTTNEDIKGSFSSKRTNSVTNPYSSSSVFGNCYSILCSPLSPR